MFRNNSVAESKIPHATQTQQPKKETHPYFFVKALNTIYWAASTGLSAVIRNTPLIGDLYQLKTNEHHFLLSDLYGRAAHKSNITYVTTAPACFAKCTKGAYPNRLYVITGSKANLMAVSDYGERNGDLASRFAFALTEEIVGRPNLMNVVGEDVKPEKNLMRKHIINSQAIHFAVETTKRRFRKMMDSWKPELSFQDQMSYVGANIMGECLMGVPELDMKYIPELREVAKVLLDPKLDPKKIQGAALFFKKLNAELFSNSDQVQEILDAKKFITDDFELHQGDFKSSEEEKDHAEALRQKLLQRKGASLFIVEGNISSTITAAVAYLNQYPEIKARLRKEINDYKAEQKITGDKSIRIDELRKLPYLDAIYLEVLRILSSAPVVVRKTSEETTLTIEDAKGQRKNYQIPAHSLLFFPTRSQHFDPRNFPNPTQFDPSRFEFDPEDPIATSAAKELRRKVTAFSAGARACVAQAGFVEAVIKTVLEQALDYKVTLDKRIEDVPVHTLEPYWRQEYHAQVEKEVEKNTVRMALSGA